MFMDLLQPFAISLMLGLAVGIDRERRAQAGDGTMGIRTFAIIALMGTVASKIDSVAVTAGLLFLLSMVVSIGYVRATSVRYSGRGRTNEEETSDTGPTAELGITTEVSAALVFALGYLAIQERILAGILGIVLVTTLYSRRYLHFFSRTFLQPADIWAALMLSISAFIIMPFLPIVPLDPWGLLVPRRIMQIMLLIGSTEFVGYLSQRILGEKIGALAAGFLGGLVSSTAVFLSVARRTKREQVSVASAIGSALAATSATLLLFVAVIATASSSLVSSAGIPVLFAAITVGLCSYFSQRHNGHQGSDHANKQSPLDLRRVLALSGLVVGLLAVTAIVKRFVGTEAFAAISLISGLFELQATTFAAAMLHQSGEVSREAATHALLAAVLASFISKLGISWVLGSARFAIWISVSLVAAAGVGVLVYNAMLVF